MTAVIGAPVFDHEGEPTLYVVVGSRQKHFQFETADAKFVQGVGAMLVAGLLQEKILAADQAKLAFVSQVSHGALSHSLTLCKPSLTFSVCPRASHTYVRYR